MSEVPLYAARRPLHTLPPFIRHGEHARRGRVRLADSADTLPLVLWCSSRNHFRETPESGHGTTFRKVVVREASGSWRGLGAGEVCGK